VAGLLQAELAEFIERMPKIELHLHLEGSVQPRTLLELAARNRVSLPVNDLAGIEQLFHYRDFQEFLRIFMTLVQAIVTGEDFERLAYELGVDLAGQQVRYAEVMLSPMQYIRRGVNLREAIAGTAAGFARVRRETGLEVRMALDFGRQYGTEHVWLALDAACAAMPQGMVGWSIGGNEVGYPPEPFAEVFAAARAAGLRLMAHAGEVVGPASVWGAVDVLGCERIGHGIRAIEDAALIEQLRVRGIVLDVCPSSNVRTGAASSWESHPLRRLFDAGVTVTVNTDDPTFFHTTIAEEYRRVARHFGFDAAELSALVLNAARASFLPQAERDDLVARVDQELHELRRAYNF
jgi:adenosine deaminase